MKKRLLLTCFLLVLFSGCASKKVSWYVLSPAKPARHKVHATHKQVRHIGLEKIILPQYLQTDNITFRVNQNKLHQEQFHKWAEPLNDNISRVIAVTVHNTLRNIELVPDPWPFGTPINMRLRVTILRFDSDADCVSHLTATWALYDKDDTKLLFKRTKRYTSHNDSSNISDIVHAMSNNVNHFARDIALSIGYYRN